MSLPRNGPTYRDEGDQIYNSKKLYRVGFCNEKIENSSNLKKNRIFLNFDFNFEGKWGYHRQGSCQAGLGADIAEVIYHNNYTYLRDWHVCKYS